VATGQELHTLLGFTKKARRVLFSPDGLRLAALGYDSAPSEGVRGREIQTLRLWDAAGGQEVRLLVGPGNTVTGLGFTLESDAVVASFANGSVKTWETQTGSERQGTPLGAKPEHATEMAVSPDGLLAAEISSGGRVLIKSLPSGQVVHTLPLLSGSAGSLTFSHDSRWLAIASGDGSVQLWTRAGIQGEVQRRRPAQTP
jgi:WD40 repeat protein